MSNKIFNTKLFFDELKQLRLIALICGFLTLLISLLIPLLSALSNVGSEYIYYYIPSPIESIPILFPYVFIAGIFFTYSAFSFLNKRNESDFYHSLPNTRICTYLSIGAAVMTWIIATVVVTTLLTWGVNLIFGLPFNNFFIPYLFFAFIAMAFLIAGTAMFAVSVTGTRFSNIVLTIVLLCLPRFLIGTFTSMVSTVAPIIESENMGWFANSSINLPYSLLSSVFNIFTYDDNPGAALLSSGSIIYTFILGIIYIGLGCVCFKIRRSETAGMSAQNKILQTIYRCAVALPFLLILADMFIRDGLTDIFGDHYSLNTIIILVLISLISYFLFEVITTKKLKSMLKAAPFYVIPVVFCALLAGSASIYGNAVLNTVLEADEINYVTIDSGSSQDYGMEGSSFREIMIRDIKYDDPDLNEIIVSGLAKSVEYIKTDKFYEAEVTGRNFGITLNNGKHFSRVIYLNNKDYKKVRELKMKNPEYRTNSRIFPEDDEITYMDISMNPTQTKNLWQSFKREAADLSDEDFESVLSSSIREAGMDYSSENSFSFGINIYGYIGKYNFTQPYSINEKTPETMKMYFDYINGKNAEKVKNSIDSIIDGSYSGQKEYSVYIDIRNTDGKPVYLFSSMYDLDDEEYYDTMDDEMIEDIDSPYQYDEPGKLSTKNLKSVLEIIRKSGFREAEVGEITVNISISEYDLDNDKSSDKEMYIRISGKELDAIRAINSNSTR